VLVAGGWDEEEVLDGLVVAVLAQEGLALALVLAGEGVDAARDYGDAVVVFGFYALAEEDGELGYVFVEQQLHVVEHVVLLVEYLLCVLVVCWCYYVEVFTLYYFVLFLLVILLLHLFTRFKNLLHSCIKLWRFSIDFNKIPIFEFLSFDKGFEFINLLKIRPRDNDINIISIELGLRTKRDRQ
jgi:hypothetical protein